MSLVAGAFELHDSVTPDTSMTTALPGGQKEPATGVSDKPEHLVRDRREQHYTANPLLQESKSLTAELLSLLPSRDVAALLVDTYFDRIHWFTLIFHQQDFRENWKKLYDYIPGSTEAASPHPHPGMVSTFLVVIAIALQYAGSHRKLVLRSHNVDPSVLKENILALIRSKLLEIVSFQSIEAVQTCVLLGTYYLYHGSPSLAWPVCGCGLRLAQALKLHRRLPTSGPISQQLQGQIETRKRCWWAIYEIETFCSISYGYPHGIVDTDCNVELLNPLATSGGQPPPSYDEGHMCPASLLSYKYLMSKLSVILKQTLADLYGIGSHQSLTRKEAGSSLNFKELIRKVPTLDDRLEKWKGEIPDPLRLTYFNHTNYACGEEMDRDIGAAGPGFESHIYQLQALALALAYENARILIHRPLVSFRTKLYHDQGSVGASDSSKSPALLSLQACRGAAMNTSRIGDSPIFALAAETYAAAFISIHTFTAGVMLCVVTSIETFTPESQESKLGLRRLLSMQAQLKSKSQCTLSSQGLEILERLTRLVMEKELKELLAPGSDASLGAGLGAQITQRDQQRDQQIQLDAQLGEGMNVTCRDHMPEVVVDTNVSQALSDLDQVLFTQELDPSTDPFFYDMNMSNNSFSQEQAWIWGMEKPAQFNEE
ncbi:fungal-specific transcription factor domain-containing protein [Penicillium brevicompactum]|uniref:Fungal-specific transcription factor domain-containing protein n=1 Tax=Penicillium brevicompactum TaxID=5074 RepID=A0A9W9RFB5_PENBR|nr:fungal-specific transcription factor domain-containing protein [Penicillium brevicompactum]